MIRLRILKVRLGAWGNGGITRRRGNDPFEDTESCQRARCRRCVLEVAEAMIRLRILKVSLAAWGNGVITRRRGNDPFEDTERRQALPEVASDICSRRGNDPFEDTES